MKWHFTLPPHGGGSILMLWWKYIPLYEKAWNKTKTSPMETTKNLNSPGLNCIIFFAVRIKFALSTLQETAFDGNRCVRIGLNHFSFCSLQDAVLCIAFESTTFHSFSLSIFYKWLKKIAMFTFSMGTMFLRVWYHIWMDAIPFGTGDRGLNCIGKN